MERVGRYRDKLNLISKRAEEIEKWIMGYTREKFVGDEKTKLAVYKAFQEIVEAEMDVIAMICKDSGLAPKDDYTNIEALEDNGIIDEGMKSFLIGSNGLRNRLVHLYNKLDDVIAFKGIKELMHVPRAFVKMVEGWIAAKLRK
ncbi:MAG: DUF86 domain-containing protein [Candidatus Thermoplasmatota archaeon]|nr:DUF86 domain-containing protein [Candidatus Thermoplasmatota archaeon]